MKQYSVTKTTSQAAVVFCCLFLTLSQASPAKHEFADKTSHRDKRSAISSGRIDNDAEDSSKPIGAPRPALDDYNVGGGLESAAHESYYNTNNRPVSEFERLRSGTEGPAYSDYLSAAMLAATDPYRRYGLDNGMYGSATPFDSFKSANIKREDSDSKGQFRLRFGRSGVRLRFGRSDPPTLRFG